LPPYPTKNEVALMNTYHQLTQEERYVITAQRMGGSSQADIARMLGRAPSTIGRELKRNATAHDGRYRAEVAHSYASARLRRCRRKARFSAAEMAEVTKMLRRKLSPEQISGVLKTTGRFSISHETIYRRIRWDKKAGGELWKHMRIMSKIGRKRYRSHDSRGVLPGKRSIHTRPAEVQARQQVGHWEGDTVMGSDKRHCVLTLVERKTGVAIIKKLKARTKDEVTKAATRAIRRHCRQFKTITFDNGTEFHDYALLEQRFPVTVYFATPYHSWERGSNENFNGLVRQYLPKGTCMSTVTQSQCDHIAYDLNNRPRKRHGFRTPANLYHRG
jgi:transposase, IS30 family